MNIEEQIQTLDDTELNLFIKALDSPLSSLDTGEGAAWKLLAELEGIAIHEVKKRATNNLKEIIPDTKPESNEKRIELGNKPGYHFLTSRRLEWVSDISENCQCALWHLWGIKYPFGKPEDIPITPEELDVKLQAFAEMSQEERTSHRKYVADGLYHADGVDYPCPVCGYQVEEEFRQ